MNNNNHLLQKYGILKTFNIQKILNIPKINKKMPKEQIEKIVYDKIMKENIDDIPGIVEKSIYEKHVDTITLFFLKFYDYIVENKIDMIEFEKIIALLIKKFKLNIDSIKKHIK